MFIAFHARLRSTAAFDSVERAMPIFLPRFLAALRLVFLLGDVLSSNANFLPITRG